MAPSDDWRPYTIPYSGDGAIRRSDGTWVPSSQYHSAPLNFGPQPAHSSMTSSSAPPGPMNTSATAVNETGGPSHGAAGSYTAMGFSLASGDDGENPDIPSVPGRDPFEEVAHPRFAAERSPGEGIPCTGGNPPSGCGERAKGAGVWEVRENVPNGQDVKGSK